MPPLLMSKSNPCEDEAVPVPPAPEASLFPQRGQVSKPAATSPVNNATPCRCSTVTSVRTVRLVLSADVAERKKLARLDRHLESRFVPLPPCCQECCGGRRKKASDKF